MTDAVIQSTFLACAPEAAFSLFTERASAWWPPSHRHTGDPEGEIRMLPSGRFWERARDGREVELGRVRLWSAPERLELDFYVATGPDQPTRVLVRFEPEEGGTRVTVEHRPTPASEGAWAARAPRFEASWARLLKSLAELPST